MVAARIVDGEALFWVDGMDDPRPVGELFVEPVRKWGKVIVRMAVAIVLVMVGFLFTMLVIGPETGAWWESTRVVQFVRKLIYIVFFKQDA
jgi:hypothetical protein